MTSMDVIKMIDNHHFILTIKLHKEKRKRKDLPLHSKWAPYDCKRKTHLKHVWIQYL